MAPPLPATLVHCAVFSTSSRARRQRSPGPGTTAREHCRLASCKAVFVVLPLSWWRSQRPGRASPLPPVRPWSLVVSQCFWADPSLSPPSTAFFRLPLRLARLTTHHAHAGGTRQIPIAPARRPAGHQPCGGHRCSAANSNVASPAPIEPVQIFRRCSRSRRSVLVARSAAAVAIGDRRGHVARLLASKPAASNWRASFSVSNGTLTSCRPWRGDRDVLRADPKAALGHLLT